MRKLLLALTVLIMAAAPAHAKRVAAAEVAPVEFGGDICRTQFVANNAGYDVYVECVDAKSGKPSWKTRIYGAKSDPKLEQDVQHVHPVKMSLQGKIMVVTDEKGRTHKLDAMTGALISE